MARAVIDLLPDEDIVYIGDTGRYPYGDKPLDEVRTYARELAWSLIEEHGAKAIVVACNTAAAALPVHELEAELSAAGHSVPVLGVIEPGAEALVRATRSGTIGVIGTIGTVQSGAYDRAVARAGVGARMELVSAACPGFVEFVERGRTSGPEVTILAERLLEPVKSAHVDALLLGCTHYPFLARVISEVMGPGVTLVSSADETAFVLRDHLLGLDLVRPARANSVEGPVRHEFFSSGDVARFRELGSRLLGPELNSAREWSAKR